MTTARETNRGIAVMLVKLFEVAKARGLTFDASSDGCLEYDVGEYAVSVNGSREPRKNGEGDDLPGGSALVKSGGWPVAMCNAVSGMTLGGSEPGEVEQAIIAACELDLAVLQ